MFGDVANVTMGAITPPQFGGVGLSDFGNNFRELRAADAQDTFIAMRERPACDENRGAGSIFQRKRFEKFAYKCDLGSFFGGCCYGFARPYEPAHEVKRLRASS